MGDYEYMNERGFEPLGMEPLAVGVSSNASHMITPSETGPVNAMVKALSEAELSPHDFVTIEMHASGSPGDYSEVLAISSLFRDYVLLTARKGTFGHGMSAGAGWEMTAQLLGFQDGALFPTVLREHELNGQIRTAHQRFLFDKFGPATHGVAGKLSLGVGGIASFLVSRPW